MNLRIPSGLAHSFLTLDEASVAPGLVTAGRAGCSGTGVFDSHIVSPGWNCVSNSSLDHYLDCSVGPTDLWTQVQKRKKSVDFTSFDAFFAKKVAAAPSPPCASIRHPQDLDPQLPLSPKDEGADSPTRSPAKRC